MRVVLDVRSVQRSDSDTARTTSNVNRRNCLLALPVLARYVGRGREAAPICGSVAERCRRAHRCVQSSSTRTRLKERVSTRAKLARGS